MRAFGWFVQILACASKIKLFDHPRVRLSVPIFVRPYTADYRTSSYLHNILIYDIIYINHAHFSWAFLLTYHPSQQYLDKGYPMPPQMQNKTRPTEQVSQDCTCFWKALINNHLFGGQGNSKRRCWYMHFKSWLVPHPKETKVQYNVKYI